MSHRESRKETSILGSPDDPERVSAEEVPSKTRIMGSEADVDLLSPASHSVRAGYDSGRAAYDPPIRGNASLAGEPDPQDIPLYSSIEPAPSDSWDPENEHFPLLPVEEPRRDWAKRELALAVELALARFALSGPVYIDEYTLILETPRGTVSQDAKLEVIRWERQDEEQRQRSAALLARRLSERVAISEAPQKKLRPRLDTPTMSLGVVAIALLGLTFYLNQGHHSTTPQGESVVAMSAIDQARVVADERVKQACELTRARVYRGGQVSIADAEGWVVELSLIGAPGDRTLVSAPEITDFLGPIRNGAAPYVWNGEKQLALTENSRPPVELNSFSVPDATAPRSGLTLTFKGSFVESYFDETGRSKFAHFAHSMATKLHPAHAALYARCAHDEIHALGSWFMGADGPGATTSLLYFLGMFARPRHVEPIYYRPPGSDAVDHSLALASIAQNTAHLDRAALATLVGSEGGMALGGGNSPVVITFPFGDGNRASRVSRTIARVTSLSR